MKFLNVTDVAIIAGSLLLVVIVGLLASRKQDKTARGYFLASGRLPWYIIGAAFVSTSVSSEQIVGTVGKAYEAGMGIANWEWFFLPVYTLVMVFFIPIYLKNRIATVPEFLSRRYGSLCGDIYSWVMVLAYVVVFLVPVLYSGSKAVSGMTGWGLGLVLWTMVILVGLYAIKGGLKSVMWTDALQCLMLVGGGVLLFFVALNKVPGGWSAMAAANPDRFHLYRPPGDPNAPFLGLLAGTVGVFLFYQSTNQVMIQRVFGARSAWDGILGIIFASFVNLARPLVTCFLGLIVYHWIFAMHLGRPLANKDDAFAFALGNIAPTWGIRGIIMAGFLAAVMSTVSALANSTATIFSLDVYKKLINKDADDRRLVMVGRLASLCALVGAALLAPSVERLGGIFNYFQQGVTYLATPFVSVMILGLLWKRTNYQGALFGLVGGLIIQIAVALGFPALGMNLHWFYLAFIAEVVIMAGVVVVSLATPPPAAENWKPFHWTPAALARYNESDADGKVKFRPWYQSLLLWYGVFAAIWFYLYWRFW